MKKIERLKQLNYTKLDRKETMQITGGCPTGPSCSQIRSSCASRCGNDYNSCFYSCVSNANCPV